MVILAAVFGGWSWARVNSSTGSVIETVRPMLFFLSLSPLQECYLSFLFCNGVWNDKNNNNNNNKRGEKKRERRRDVEPLPLGGSLARLAWLRLLLILLYAAQSLSLACLSCSLHPKSTSPSCRASIHILMYIHESADRERETTWPLISDSLPPDAPLPFKPSGPYTQSRGLEIVQTFRTVLHCNDDDDDHVVNSQEMFWISHCVYNTILWCLWNDLKTAFSHDSFFTKKEFFFFFIITSLDGEVELRKCRSGDVLDREGGSWKEFSILNKKEEKTKSI